MDLTWFRANARTAKKYCASVNDRIKYLLLLYSNSGKWHKLTGDKEYTINFVFDDPIGKVSLKLRNNQGSDSFIFSELFLHSYYDLKMISKPSTILDLGANIGLTALFWSRVYPSSQLACVEPMPNNLEVLKWNVQKNNVNATVIGGAVATEDGEVYMEMAEKDYGHQIAANPADGRHNIKVRSYSMDSIMKQLGWHEIDLLKIDIEGYEGHLLKENREWLHRVNYMIIEIHEAWMVSLLEELAGKYNFTKPRDINGLWHLAKIK